MRGFTWLGMAPITEGAEGGLLLSFFLFSHMLLQCHPSFCSCIASPFSLLQCHPSFRTISPHLVCAISPLTWSAQYPLLCLQCVVSHNFICNMSTVCVPFFASQYVSPIFARFISPPASPLACVPRLHPYCRPGLCLLKFLPAFLVV